MSEPVIEWDIHESGNYAWMTVNGKQVGHIHSGYHDPWPFYASYDGVGKVYCNTQDQAMDVMELWAKSEVRPVA